MEIPAWVYFSFWAITSFTFLHLAFIALDRNGLAVSVFPVVMSLLKHSLAISACHSSSYALIFRQRLKLSIDRRYFWLLYGMLFPILYYRSLNDTSAYGALLFVLTRFTTWLLHSRLPLLKAFSERYSLILVTLFFSSDSFSWFLPIFSIINIFMIYWEYFPHRGQRICAGIHMALEASLFLVSGKHTEFYPILVVFISFLTSAYWAGLSGLEPYTLVSGDPLSGDETFQKLLPVAAKLKENFLGLKEKLAGKWIEFAVGMVGTVLFQYFFRLTSFNHVVAFLFVAVVWAANIALVGGGSGDLGVFTFLLMNVIVGGTVSQSGVRAKTWLACVTCLFLYGLKLRLESASPVDGPGEETRVIVW